MTGISTPADASESGCLLIGRREALRDSLYAWLAHEVLVALVMVLSVRVGVAGAGLVHAHLLRPPVTWSDLLHVWMGWGDAGAYAQLATRGYGQAALAPYFPLLPLLDHILSTLIGGDAAAAGLVIANVSALPAFYLLRSLAESETGDRHIARITLILAAFSPFGFFLTMGYTESLFLLLSLGVFRAARDRHWIVAGSCAALAVLTRATGVLLLLPIAISVAETMSWRFTRWKPLARPLIALALPIVALLAFWIFEAHMYGMPLAASHYERTYYARWLDWPWYGPGVDVALVVRHLDLWPTVLATLELLTLIAALVGCIALVTVRSPRLPLSYVVYGWAVLVLTLVLPVHGADSDALYSLPRYLLIDFPICLAIAMLCSRRRNAHVVVIAGSIIACLQLALLQTAAFAIA